MVNVHVFINIHERKSENRLTSVTLPGTGGTVNFKYDPFGRRIEKVSPAGTTVYAYDGDNVIEELDGSGNLLAHYTQGAGIDEPLAIYRGLTTSYFHADGLGSTTSLTDAVGQVAASYVYDSFGKLTASTGTVTNPFQYTGREFDSETGLYYYRARYYDPTTGRFLSEDPIGLKGGLNFYPYVHSRPTRFVDPSGLLNVIPLPEANYLNQDDIDAACGLTAGGCNKVDYRPDFVCEHGCDGDIWRARFTIRLVGNIYLAAGPFPYKGRQPRDRSIRDTASARRHEELHTQDKVNAIRPIFERVEARTFASKEDCEQAAAAAEVEAGPRWNQAGEDSERRRH